MLQENKIKRFFHIPVSEIIMFIKTFILIFIIKLLIHFIPIKYYLFLFQAKPRILITENYRNDIIRFSQKTMRRIIRFSPWHYSCLVKSLCYKLLLNSKNVKSTIVLRVSKLSPQLIAAHAFVSIDNDESHFNDLKYSSSFMLK